MENVMQKQHFLIVSSYWTLEARIRWYRKHVWQFNSL